MSIDKRVFSTAEAASLGAFGGGWRVNTRVNISSAVQKHHTIDLAATRILLQSDSNIRIRIDKVATTANVVNDDLILVGNGLTIHEISVPKGIQAGVPAVQLYLHILQATSVAAKYCKVIEA